MSDRPLRLRLHIQRNGLPDTRIVFLANATENTTVMQLLEQVNETVPLESPDWGLDDYAVELPSPSSTSSSSASPSKRFECLHYQLVAKLFDKDDEVFIRPLSSEDLKKLRIGGRHQISLDGKHLVDGVPFGRPLLKRPRGRPPVAIAPRKRARPSGNGLLEFEESEEEEEEDDDYGMQMVPYTTNEEEDEDEEYEDDEDVDVDADELRLLQEDAQTLSTRSASERIARNDNSGWSGFDNSSNVSDYNDFSKEGSDFDSDDDSDDDGKFHSLDSESASDSDSDSYDNQKDSGDESESESSDDEGPLEMSSKKPDQTPAPVPATAQPSTAPAPNQGKTRTKKRNARRRAKRAMDKAREQEADENGIADTAAATVPSTETSAEAVVQDIEKALAESPASFSRRLRLDMGAGRRLIASALGLGSSNKTALADLTKAQPVEQPKEQTVPAEQPLTNGVENKATPPPGHPDHWASRIDYTAVECCDANFELDKPSFPFVQQWHSIKGQNKQQKTGAAGHAGTKRKQDFAGATDESKPKKRAAPSTSSESSSDSSYDSSSEDSSDEEEAARKKTVTADDEDYIVSARSLFKKVINSNGLQGDDLDSDSDDSSFDGGDDDSESSSEEEDDESDGDEVVENGEDIDDVTTAAIEEEDLPPLPAEISSLPILEPGHAVEGMVVTWKNWVLSEQTNWQPQVADVTARIVSVRDEGKALEVVLAQRDRELDSKPAKQYDEETGERVYGRFDGPDMEDDEAEDAEDNGQRTVVLAELIEPRILKGV